MPSLTCAPGASLASVTPDGDELTLLPGSSTPKKGFTAWGSIVLAFDGLTGEKEAEFLEFVSARPKASFARCVSRSRGFGIEVFTRKLRDFFVIQNEIKARFSSIILEINAGSLVKISSPGQYSSWNAIARARNSRKSASR